MYFLPSIPYIMQRMGDENTQTYQEAVILIWYQIPIANFPEKFHLLEGSINNWISGVKGLK